ncbi:glycoside hydrolase family 1 protein [Saccharibacillus kuerlensis]|uniref:Beta-glucosidase n=1 Tax=Saccharibacillus kuerlensis TaxID=459527 RepID=A0ABQ2L8R2_9BACL|nr:family 1 glycosylhydrolase [Saccharibacillus kuerlensis]GGO06665.1 beta-glucosidase [Saccharibacillus kuerlensis]
MQLKFPETFIWGTATAAHQVEGYNDNCDVWAEEHSEGSPYKDLSGAAVDHYNRFREDIALMADIGLKSYRFSVEWARIEPEPGVYSAEQLDHYREVVQTCLKYGLKPLVTMFHFTSPQWLMRDGGWSNPETADRFAKYCEVVFREIGEPLDYVLTFNEANLPVMLKELFTNMEFMPPVGMDAKSWIAPGWRESAARACGTTVDRYFTFHMASEAESIAIVMDAHRKARAAMKAIKPSIQIGMSLALPDVQAIEGGEELAAAAWQDYFGQFLPVIREDDFLGVQNYTTEIYGSQGVIPAGEEDEKTDMGYAYAPEALGAVVRKVHRDLKLPILITEHGIATEDDAKRLSFIREGLKGLHACIQEGIDVRAYAYWSTFDNFEWTFGYTPRFGIIAVDRETQARTVKNSGKWLGRVAQNSVLPLELKV